MVLASSEPGPVWYAGPATRWGELWTMLHLPYTGMVLSFVAIGAVLSPRFSAGLLTGTLLAYFFGLGIGAHFLDQVEGMGSRYVHHWTDAELWTGGVAGLLIAVGLGMLAAARFVGWLLLPFIGVQALCAVGYPLARWFRGVLHRDTVFAISWGALPFLTSFYAQSGTVTTVALSLAALFGGVAVLEIRLSRASRARRARIHRDAGPTASAVLRVPAPYARFDRALQFLSLGMIALAVGVAAFRFLLGL